LHQFVQAKGVGKAVNRVELAGHEDAFEDFLVGETLDAEGIDIVVRDLVGIVCERDRQAEECLVFLLDRQRLDVGVTRGIDLFLAASDRPQEK
jgi:hypothetical protein